MGRNQTMTADWNTPTHQILVRNRDDAYCTPDLHKLSFKGPRTFISLSGTHDDCWDTPEPYIRIIQEFTKKAVA